IKCSCRKRDAGPLRLGPAENHARDGEGRGRLPALRPLRRALPHRRLGHAEIPRRNDASRLERRPLPQESRVNGDSHQFPMSITLAAPSSTTKVERELRVQLAAAYRVADFLGWSELIYTHISVRIPGPEHHFLINPYGL